MKCSAMLVWSWSPLTFTSRHQCALHTHCQTDKSLGPSSPTPHASLLPLTSVWQPCFMQYLCQGFGIAISFEAKNLNIQSESNSNFWLHVVALILIPSSVYKRKTTMCAVLINRWLLLCCSSICLKCDYDKCYLQVLTTNALFS